MVSSDAYHLTESQAMRMWLCFTHSSSMVNSVRHSSSFLFRVLTTSIACLFMTGSAPASSSAPSSSSLISAEGYSFLKYWTSSSLNSFHTWSQSTSLSVHFLDNGFLRSALGSKPPHLLVHMLANQHSYSRSKVALSLVCQGCVKSLVIAVV